MHDQPQSQKPHEPVTSWGDYRRIKVFLRPYTRRLALILATSLVATGLGLTQPYISKLLIDVALMRRDWRALCWVAAAMFGATILGFALNILSSYQYVRVSAAMLFDMRVALYRRAVSFNGPSLPFLDACRTVAIGGKSEVTKSRQEWC